MKFLKAISTIASKCGAPIRPAKNTDLQLTKSGITLETICLVTANTPSLEKKLIAILQETRT